MRITRVKMSQKPYSGLKNLLSGQLTEFNTFNFMKTPENLIYKLFLAAEPIQMMVD